MLPRPAAAMLGYLWAVGRDDDDVVEDGEPDVIDTAWRQIATVNTRVAWAD